MSLSLRDFLSSNGIQTAKVAAAPAPVAPAPAKVAVGGKMAPPNMAGSKTSPKADAAVAAPHNTGGKTASAQINWDTSTYQQKWLAEHGMVCPDAKTASIVYAQQVKIAEGEKRAEMEKNAEEARSYGAIVYHGMMKEACAMQYAAGEIDDLQVLKTAGLIGVHPQVIVKRADFIRAQMPSPALFGDQLGSAIRTNTSATQTAAEQCKSTVMYEPQATQGTRQAESGNSDPKLNRFEDTATLPGNPGLNMGMGVNQGKGLNG